jgi:hypothetical protein
MARQALTLGAERLKLTSMRDKTTVLLAGALLFTAGLLAQEPAANNDFDYLIGDWEYEAVSKQWGKFHGLWSAVKLADGQILDEYRVTGDKGETYYVTTTLRNYNKAKGQWELVGLEPGNGIQDIGTGKKAGAEMHIEQRFGTGTPEESLWRIRYFNIKPDRFSWAADRSTDGGKSWTKDYQTIEAKRIGAARKMEPLTKVKASAPAP